MPRYPGSTAAPGLEVTDDPATATRSVAEGTSVVLVSADAAGLGAVLAGAADRDGRERRLAVMVGDPGDPAVRAAAEEMAAELARPEANDGDRPGAGPGAGDGAGR